MSIFSPSSLAAFSLRQAWPLFNSHRRADGIGVLLELLEQLRRGALGGAVLQVEDCCGRATRSASRHMYFSIGGEGVWDGRELTLFNTVLLRALVIVIFLRGGDALDAFVKVVLEADALG